MSSLQPARTGARAASSTSSNKETKGKAGKSSNKAKEVFKKLGRSLSKKRKPEVIPWLPLLPPEILLRIVSFLDVPSLCAASCVSSEWQAIAENDRFWFHLYCRQFYVDPIRPVIKAAPELPWKKNYECSFSRLLLATQDIDDDPEDCENFVNRGMLQMELGHYEAALVDYNRAISVCKAHPEVNHSVDQALFFARRASLNRILNHKEDSYADIAMSIEIDPDVANYRRIRGDWWRADGFLERALVDYDSAILSDGSMAALYFQRALILLDLKHFDMAMKNLDIAIQLDPTNAEYYCTRGRILSNFRDIDGALRDLEQAVALDPTVSRYFHWRGRLYREKEEMEKALDDFEKAVALSGDDIDFSWRAIAYAQLKRTPAAIRDIDNAIDRSPANSFHHQYKGILTYGLGRYVNALEAFSRGIELLPTWSSHYVWRAAVHYDLGDFTRCQEDLDRASSLDPSDGPLFWRGLLQLRTGKRTEALYDLKASLKEAKKLSADPDATPPSRILFWLGVTHRLLGDEKEAQHMLQRVPIIAATEVAKVAKHSEPARTALLAGDISKAKHHYKHMLSGHYAVDAYKTEQSHLDLLAILFPSNTSVADVRTWFNNKRKLLFSAAVSSEKFKGSSSSEQELACSLSPPLVRSDSTKAINYVPPASALSAISLHARSNSF